MNNHTTIIFLRLILVIALTLFLAGCSKFNCTMLEKNLGADENLITLATRITDNLTRDAFPPLLPRQPDMPILITTFVDNNDLKKTSRFGRILQEHITSRLVGLGYTTKELKLRDTLLMQEHSGETMLSRNLQEINAKHSLSAQSILVGTYSYTDRTMYISARLINPKDRTIISSYDYRLCMDDNVLTMFGLKRQSPHATDEISPPRESFINTLFY